MNIYNTSVKRPVNATLPTIARGAILATAIAFASSGINAQEVKFRNEATDTTRITNILIEECRQPSPGNIARIAQIFIDSPYKGATLESDGPEALTVNLDEFDCTTLMETAVALAYTAYERRPSWRDFAYNLRRFRYRNGETDGYPSRLHYMSEWIVDNVARGNIKEITGDLPQARYQVKSLDYMSSHADAYPALADSTNLVRVKNMESGFSNHRYPYIKGSDVKSKTLGKVLRDGDIVFFTTATKGLDITHVGIIVMDNGTPMLLHASSKEGKVTLDPLSLEEYVRRNRNQGIRIVRMVKD